MDADIVVPVPDSGNTAAIGYAAESGIPFPRLALIRNHYIGRTFIEPQQSVRDFGVKLRTERHPQPAGRQARDSGGTTRLSAAPPAPENRSAMIRNAGAKEVHMRISCPPTIFSVLLWEWTHLQKELIGANKTIEEIREFIVADSLAYLSLEGLKKACGDLTKKTTYCSACYTGNYPTKIDVEEILPAAATRAKPLRRLSVWRIG